MPHHVGLERRAPDGSLLEGNFLDSRRRIKKIDIKLLVCSAEPDVQCPV